MTNGGHVEISRDGMVCHGPTISETSVFGGLIARTNEVERTFKSMGAATERTIDRLGVLSGTRTAYTDEEYAERMQEAEAAGVQVGFDDAIEQVTELLVKLARETGYIDPDKEHVWTGLGELKPTTSEG